MSRRKQTRTKTSTKKRRSRPASGRKGTTRITRTRTARDAKPATIRIRADGHTQAPVFSALDFVAVMTGLGVCLLLVGVARRCETVFVTAADTLPVTSAGLICLAVGAIVPSRLARLEGRGRRPGLHHVPFASGDRSLLWTVLAVVALAAGLAMAGTIMILPFAERGYQWLAERFLWPSSMLRVVQTLVMVIALSPALVSVGLLTGCVCRLGSGGRGWSLQPVGWGLVGVGAGAVISQIVAANLAGETVLLTAAVPLLVVAVLAVRLIGASEGKLDQPEALPQPLPDRSDREPILIRVSAVWLAAAAAAVVLIWMQVSRHWLGGDGGSSLAVVGALAAMIGVGLIVGERWQWTRGCSAAGAGISCAVAGIGVACAAALPAAWLGGASWRAVPPGAILLAGCLSSLLVGFALAYAHRAVLARSGSRGAVGAGLLSLSLGASAVLLLTLGESGAAAKGMFAALTTVALSLVALGGAIVIHEPAGSPRVRTCRVGVLFVSIAALIVLMPRAGRRWAHRPDTVSVQGVHTATGTGSPAAGSGYDKVSAAAWPTPG